MSKSFVNLQYLIYKEFVCFPLGIIFYHIKHRDSLKFINQQRQTKLIWNNFLELMSGNRIIAAVKSLSRFEDDIAIDKYAFYFSLLVRSDAMH